MVAYQFGQLTLQSGVKTYVDIDNVENVGIIEIVGPASFSLNVSIECSFIKNGDERYTYSPGLIDMSNMTTVASGAIVKAGIYKFYLADASRVILDSNTNITVSFKVLIDKGV